MIISRSFCRVAEHRLRIGRIIGRARATAGEVPRQPSRSQSHSRRPRCNEHLTSRHDQRRHVQLRSGARQRPAQTSAVGANTGHTDQSATGLARSRGAFAMLNRLTRRPVLAGAMMCSSLPGLGVLMAPKDDESGGAPDESGVNVSRRAFLKTVGATSVAATVVGGTRRGADRRAGAGRPRPGADHADDQRQEAPADGRAARHAARRDAQSSRPHRPEAGLRSRHLRRLHR